MSSIVAGLDRRKVLMSGSSLATAILLPKVASATAEGAGITQTGTVITQIGKVGLRDVQFMMEYSNNPRLILAYQPNYVLAFVYFPLPSYSHIVLC